LLQRNTKNKIQLVRAGLLKPGSTQETIIHEPKTRNTNMKFNQLNTITMQFNAKIKKQLFVVIACFSVLTSFAQTAPAPIHLRCDLMEYTDRVFINGELTQVPFDQTDKLVEPVQLALVNSKQPVFSWAMADTRNNIRQAAFQLQLAASYNDLKQGKLLWDTEKTASNTATIKYAGTPISANSNYYWRVKVWNNRGEESAWSAPKGFRTGSNLYSYNSAFYPLVKSTQQPLYTKPLDDNMQFIDFGKAAFGRIKLSVDTKTKNDTLWVAFGEVISKRGRLDSNPGGSRRYRKIALALQQGYHTYSVAIEKDTRNTRANAIKMPAYIGDVYPFRYCEITGTAKVVSVSREVVNYPFNDYSSYFECSDPVLNDIWEFCKYSIKATSFAGIYVDGDRERIPYEADAYINQLCHYGVDNEYTLARRSQEHMLFNPTWPTEWILTSVLMAWKDYLYTGNADFIRHYYPELKQKTLSVLTDENGLISTRTGKMTREVLQSVHFEGKELRDIVDWPHSGSLGLSKDDSGETDGFVFTDYNAVVNAYHNKALQVMSLMAAAIGKTDDSKYYAKQAEAHKKAFNKLFFDAEKGYYNDGVDTDHSALHSNMFALSFGLVPEAHIKSVTDFVKSRGMSCSVYGSQHLLDAVYAGENAEYGLELLTADHDRGWAHAIYDVGTTITLEAWDNKYKPNQDWNHAWGAAPANIIPMRLMGIQPLLPGFEKLRIKPQPASLKWAKIKHPTIKGDVQVSFKNEPGKHFSLKVNLPANTEAEVWIPFSGEEKYVLKRNGEKVKAEKVRNFLVVENVGSGETVFDLSYTSK